MSPALVLAFACTPAVFGLMLTPLAARLLAGRIAPRRWMLGIAAWAIASTLLFAAAIHVVAADPHAVALAVLGFTFWNGVGVLAVNVVGGIVGIALRRRRP